MADSWRLVLEDVKEHLIAQYEKDKENERKTTCDSAEEEFKLIVQELHAAKLTSPALVQLYEESFHKDAAALVDWVWSYVALNMQAREVQGEHPKVTKLIKKLRDQCKYEAEHLFADKEPDMMQRESTFVTRFVQRLHFLRYMRWSPADIHAFYYEKCKEDEMTFVRAIAKAVSLLAGTVGDGALDKDDKEARLAVEAIVDYWMREKSKSIAGGLLSEIRNVTHSMHAVEVKSCNEMQLMWLEASTNMVLRLVTMPVDDRKRGERLKTIQQVLWKTDISEEAKNEWVMSRIKFFTSSSMPGSQTSDSAADPEARVPRTPDPRTGEESVASA